MSTPTIQYVGPTTVYMGKEYPVWVSTRKGYWKFERPMVAGEPAASGIRLSHAGAVYVFTTAED